MGIKNNIRDTTTFKATVVRAVYTSDDFKVYAVDVGMNDSNRVKHNKYGNVTISGALPILTDGKEYEFVGIEESGKYGYGYKIVRVKKNHEYDSDDIETFLNGILTPKQSEQIMTNYPNLLQLIQEHRENEVDLSKLHGIKEAMFLKIVNRIRMNMHLLEYIAKFQGVLSYSVIEKISRAFTTIEMLDRAMANKPYETMCSLSGVGFKTADTLLLQIEEKSNELISDGKEPILKFNSPLKTSADRCLAYIHFVLEENESGGSTRMSLSSLAERCKIQVSSAYQHFQDCLKHDSIWYDIQKNLVAKIRTREVESYISKTVLDNLKIEDENRWDIDGGKYKELDTYELTDEQVSIIDIVCNNKISILSGNSGSGKSASLSALIQALDNNNKSYKLLTPTGKSAKVLANYTDRPASTIHRGLGYNPSTGWAYNEENKIMTDIVIVDEFSMVDIWICEKLFKAIDFNKTRLLLVGDPYQLPSVSCGNVFADFISSGVIVSNHLTKIFRYGDGGLLKVATDIRNGLNCYKDITNTTTKFGDDYVYIEMNQDKIVNSTCMLYDKLLKKGYTPEDIMVLSSQNVGQYGTETLNKEIQKIANPNYGKTPSMQIGNNVYHVGDILIQKRNNYDAKSPLSDATYFIANGESGTIIDIKKKSLYIMFDGILIEYSKNDMMEYNVGLGYSISTHKSQGSSGNIVIAITPKAHTFMLNSNLLYTGLTRARKMCYHIGNITTVQSSIKKKANFSRNTFLEDFLKEVK